MNVGDNSSIYIFTYLCIDYTFTLYIYKSCPVGLVSIGLVSVGFVTIGLLCVGFVVCRLGVLSAWCLWLGVCRLGVCGLVCVGLVFCRLGVCGLVCVGLVSVAWCVSAWCLWLGVCRLGVCRLGVCGLVCVGLVSVAWCVSAWCVSAWCLWLGVCRLGVLSAWCSVGLVSVAWCVSAWCSVGLVCVGLVVCQLGVLSAWCLSVFLSALCLSASYPFGLASVSFVSVSFVSCHRGAPVPQWIRDSPADGEFLGSNLTATRFLGLPRHEMTSAVKVALNTQLTNVSCRLRVCCPCVLSDLFLSESCPVGLASHQFMKLSSCYIHNV